MNKENDILEKSLKEDNSVTELTENVDNGHVNITSPQLVPPDGGWGWMVVMGSAFMFMLSGLGVGFGVVMVPTMERFNASTASAAAIPTVALACWSFAGLAVAGLSRVYSCRVLAFAGGLLLFLAVFLCTFAQSILVIQLSYGVLGGCSIALTTGPGVFLVNKYFTTKRGRANGILTGGIGLGRMIVPQLWNFFLVEYGYQGMFLMMSAIMLHTLVAATLFQPVEKHMKKAESSIDLPKSPIELKLLLPKQQNGSDHFITPANEREMQITGEAADSNPFCSEFKKHNEAESERPVLDRQSSIHSTTSQWEFVSCPDINVGSVHSLAAINNDGRRTKLPNIGQNSEQKTKSKTKLSNISKYLPDTKVIKHPMFPILSYVFCISVLNNVTYLIYLPALMHQKGFTRADAATLLTITAGFDAAGRVILSSLTDFCPTKRKYVYICNCMIIAVSIFITTVPETFWGCVVSSAAFGLASGSCQALLITMSAEYVGPANLPFTLGWLQLFQGMGMMAGGPAIGGLKDYTGDTKSCYYVIGVLQSTIVAVCLLEPFVARRIRKHIIS